MKELWAKIKEALISALPITAIVYIVALLPWFDFSVATLIAFGVGAVMLILGIGLFNAPFWVQNRQIRTIYCKYDQKLRKTVKKVTKQN